MANETERERWGGETGAAWARHQADLDQTMAAVTALLLDRAQLARGERVLDVGCGAGDSTLAAARRVGPDGHVTGQDVSAPLLALAQARAEAAGLANVAWVEAFANIASQPRAGGRLTFVAWAAAAENPWLALPAVVGAARLGPAPVTDPDGPGPTAFRDPARVLGLLTRAGLREAKVETCDLELHHPGGVAALADLGVEVGPAAWLLRLHAGTAADREAVLRRMKEAFGAFASTDGVRIPARVLVYSAQAA